MKCELTIRSTGRGKQRCACGFASMTRSESFAILPRQGAPINSRSVGRHNTSEVYFVRLTVETEQEEDGRWIAEVSELPDVMRYGRSRAEAIAQAEALALRVIADRIEHGAG